MTSLQGHAMTTFSGTLLSLLMFTTGVGIPVMAAWNSRLGAELESPWAAAFILFVLGAIICGVAMLALGLPKHGWFDATPLYYAGGLVVSFYILSITWTAPRIGVANAVFFVLLGQIVAAALVDQFGLFGALKSPLTTQRIIGMVCMLIGTYLARRIG
jgi:bacterial/archaeal transporter family-2 protein